MFDLCVVWMYSRKFNIFIDLVELMLNELTLFFRKFNIFIDLVELMLNELTLFFDFV